MQPLLRTVSFLACACFGAVALAGDPLAIEQPQRTTAVNFETEVLPVLRLNCLACHNTQKSEAHLVLETPQIILKGGDTGPAIVPGKAAESLLLKVAAHQQESFMPPAENNVGAKNLTPQQLGLLQLWIDQGATGTVSTSRSVSWKPLPLAHRPILAVAVTPDGQYGVCSRGNELFVYQLAAAGLETKLIDPALNMADPTQAVAHRDIVRSLAFDAQGELLASGGFREVKLWRRPRLKRLAEWQHDSSLSAVVTSGDGRLAATADANGHIRIWEVATNKVLQTIEAHKAAVTSLAFSADGKTLFSASLDKSMRACQVENGAAQGATIEMAASLRSLILINEGAWLVSGGDDGMARVWETKAVLGSPAVEIKPLKEIKIQDSPLTALVGSHDKPLHFLAGAENGVIRGVNAESGELLAEMRHPGPLTSLALRRDDKRMASVGGGKAVLWNGENSQAMIELPDVRPTEKLAQMDAQVSFTKSALDLAKNDIKSYEGPERRIMTTAMDIKKAEEEKAKAEKMLEEKKAAAEKTKAESKDPKAIEAAENQVKEAETAVQVAGTIIDRAKIIAERAVKSLAAAQEAVAAKEAVLKQQEAAKAEAAAALASFKPAMRSIAFSLEGDRLAIGSEDGAIHLFTTEKIAHVETLVEHKAAVTGLAFSPQSQLISVSADNRALLFNSPSSWQLERTIRGEQQELLSDRVLSVDFSRDGKFLATGGGEPGKPGELKIWNVATGELVRQIENAHADTVFAARFSADGQLLASAGADRMVKVFKTADGSPVRSFAGHTAHVLGLSWRGNGKELASCSTDQSIKLWDIETGLQVRTMKGNTYQVGPFKREVTAIRFLGDSEQMLAASGDGTVRLQRASSDADILTIAKSLGYLYAVDATPDGRTLLVGGADGVLRRWSSHDRGISQILAP